VITDLLREALPAGLVALDFDGTLAPISLRPGDARPLDVVTGRTVASLLGVSGFGAVPGIVVYGTHGAERWQAGTLRTAAAPPGLDELRVSLPGLLASIGPGLWLEDKRLSLVVHARLTTDPDRMLEMLRVPVGQAAAAAGLAVRPGKEVLEICIPGIDKGTAIRELMNDGTTAAFYAGDDVGDLPAMQEVSAWAGRTSRPALTVGVGDGPLGGYADVTVPDPRALLSLLRQLLRLT
jgi:trehalose 6-phosphate phosphatase